MVVFRKEMLTFLCSSFLPQDKVSEFAQMSPQQLLKETQRAAGNERLSEWHRKLSDKGKDHQTLIQARMVVDLKH
jgi:structural maintenance of chromosomes protein 5